jgi:hypothetical protein
MHHIVSWNQCANGDLQVGVSLSALLLEMEPIIRF